MFVIIMGSGRLGAELATVLEDDGHEIAILDIDKYAFDHLPASFKGRKILGDGTDHCRCSPPILERYRAETMRVAA